MRKSNFWHLATVTALVAGSYGCSPEADPAEDQSTVDPQIASVRAWANKHRGVTPWRDPKAAPVPHAVAAAKLQYYGGRVISNVDVHPAYVGTINSQVQSGIQGFYQAATNSSYWTWLVEYNTPASGGTGQTIGAGTAVAPVALPGLPSSGTIDDSQIQSAISAAIASGALPAPTKDSKGNTNSYYPIFFGPGITITMGGSGSCVAGGFCAYHGTVAAQGTTPEFYYAVQPDFGPTSGCATGCGNGNEFQNNCSVASHELTEATTDAEVGLATVVGPPLAWYDTSNGEIGDICNAEQGTITVGGTTYTVQKEWSNSQGACVVGGGTCTPVCSGKQCGPDGCGGSCGTCPTGQTCDANGQCSSCTPSCTGKQCGSDGCGGSCGTCPTGQTCDANGQCGGGCTPQCSGKQCGPDGCGGTCGTCPTGQTCGSNGQCGGGGGNCKHSECVTGNRLKKNCNPCVTKICQADPFCCTFAWDDICVSEVPEFCGESCN